MLRVVIIGAGITGAAAAAQCAHEGRAVTLLEQHRVAAMASGWTLAEVDVVCALVRNQRAIGLDLRFLSDNAAVPELLVGRRLTPVVRPVVA